MRPLILKGTFLSGGTDSFQMEVRKANRHGRALRGTRELKVNAQTKFRRAGNAATLASLQPNDRLHVKVRACKRAQVLNMELMARRVVAHAPQAQLDPARNPPLRRAPKGAFCIPTRYSSGTSRLPPAAACAATAVFGTLIRSGRSSARICLQ